MSRTLQALAVAAALIVAFGVGGYWAGGVVLAAVLLAVVWPPIKRRFWPDPLPAFRSWAHEFAAQGKSMAFKRDATDPEWERWVSDVSRGIDEALGSGHAAEWLDRCALRCSNAGVGKAPHGDLPMPYHYASELLELVEGVTAEHLRDGFRPRDLPSP